MKKLVFLSISLVIASFTSCKVLPKDTFFDNAKFFTQKVLQKAFPNLDFQKDSGFAQASFTQAQIATIFKEKARKFFTAKGHNHFETLDFWGDIAWEAQANKVVITLKFKKYAKIASLHPHYLRTYCTFRLESNTLCSLAPHSARPLQSVCLCSYATQNKPTYLHLGNAANRQANLQNICPEAYRHRGRV
jgi:hypothetical protein